jgi:histidyl-tRNA synthetase
MEHQERDQFSELLDLLSLDNITFARNFRLVRGLDYYSGTCFEVKMGQGS